MAYFSKKGFSSAYTHDERSPCVLCSMLLSMHPTKINERLPPPVAVLCVSGVLAATPAPPGAAGCAVNPRGVTII